MTNFASGHRAEQLAAEFLEKQGYKIIALNWRTRYCEIDIVCRKKSTVYFVEVKYRKTVEQGTGLEYITAKKLKQMKFAAEMWVQEHNWKKDYTIAAIEVEGPAFTVKELLIDL